MNPICIIGIIVTLVLVWVEYRYSPRIDITKDGDVLLWYNKEGNRFYKYLFSLK